MSSDLMNVVIATVALLQGGEPVNHAEAYCLSKNIYHEVRGEPLSDQIRVSAVTIQTAKRRKIGICEEVHYKRRCKRSGKMVARYSWTLDPNVKDIVDEKDAWEASTRIAVLMLSGDELGHDVHDATNFYSPSKVKPWWAKDHPVVAMGDGDFIFTKRRSKK